MRSIRQVVLRFRDFVQRWTERANGRTEFPGDVRDRLVFVGSLATGNNVADRGPTPMASLTRLAVVIRRWSGPLQRSVRRPVHYSILG